MNHRWKSTLSSYTIILFFRNSCSPMEFNAVVKGSAPEVHWKCNGSVAKVSWNVIRELEVPLRFFAYLWHIAMTFPNTRRNVN